MKNIACSASAGPERPAELVTMSPWSNTQGRADLVSPAWSQWTQRNAGASRNRSSRSEASTATSTVLSAASIAAVSRGPAVMIFAGAKIFFSCSICCGL